MIPIIGSEYPKKVIPLIEQAKRNIDVVIYDWRWYPDQLAHPVQQLNNAIVQASKRGVLVRALVNADLNLETLKATGIRARRLKDKRTLHTKMILIDGRTLILGSHNFTRNAFGANIETSIAVELPEGVTRFAEFFENLYNQ
jgi:phosphatidylserine/phosphatidylglycerophosphate/cardiolipin synthase-like enzyme